MDCIYEARGCCHVHPDECVDCGACEPVCPVEAIFYEDDLPQQWAAFGPAAVEVFGEASSGEGLRVGAAGQRPPSAVDRPSPPPRPPDRPGGGPGSRLGGPRTAGRSDLPSGRRAASASRRARSPTASSVPVSAVSTTVRMLHLSAASRRAVS